MRIRHLCIIGGCGGGSGHIACMKKKEEKKGKRKTQATVRKVGTGTGERTVRCVRSLRFEDLYFFIFLVILVGNTSIISSPLFLAHVAT